MKNLGLTAVIILIAGNTLVFSQSASSGLDFDDEVTWQVGLSGGVMNCLTDLGGKSSNGKGFLKDINWKEAKACWGVYASVLYQYSLGVRLEYTFGNVAADDNVLTGNQSAAQNRYNRNLQFRSKIRELSLTMEFHPLAILANSMDNELPLFSPYVLAGIGVFKFNPEAQLDGKWIALHPLHTEGQGFLPEYPFRKPYKLTQVNLPVGLGVKYEISPLLNVRLEYIHRILLTDYLDDVSERYIDPAAFYQHLDPATAALAEQLADRRRVITGPNNAPLPNRPGAVRGNPDHNDAYFSFNLKLGIVLNRREE